MNLATYIKQLGDEKAAKLFGVKKRTVVSWRLADRKPRPEQAQKIVKASRGALTMDDVYAIGGQQ